MNADINPRPCHPSMPQAHSTYAHYVIHVTHEIGALQRLLGTVRRRGFNVDSMMATRNPMESGYRIELRLQARNQQERSFELLARQMARHLDIVSVSMLSPTAAIELLDRRV